MYKDNIFKNLDWLTVLIWISLVIIGITNIFAVEYAKTGAFNFDLSNSYSKQILWFSVSFLIALGILLIDTRFLVSISYPLYGFLIIMLIITLMFGTVVSGTKAWLDFGFFRLQVSEFGKFILALTLARYLSTYNVNIKNFRHLIISFGLIVFPVLFIMMQGDTGSSLVYLSMTLVLYRLGLSAWFLIIPIITGILFVFTLLYNEWIIIAVLISLGVAAITIVRKRKRLIGLVLICVLLASSFVYATDYAFENVFRPHQKQRINVLLGKDQDLRGAGYNIHQSLIAIGSGGLTGKGYLNGTQTRFSFVPEQNTDFIFCTIGEEHGFAGSFVLISLYLILFIRIVLLAEKQKSRFSMIYGYGIVTVFFIHFTINISMTLALFPVVGIPLPFVSYGGSSLMAYTTMLFIFLKLDADKEGLNV